ncbi:MAG: transcriptional regulator [Alphaproteobacteria bacterium]|jgi:predicted transcriptional regulator|nr:transcriptional regulator [Alphaproteobacteria bacterium]
MTEAQEEKAGVPNADLLRMTAQIVASYVGNNPTPADQLGDLIGAVHESLKNVEGAKTAQPEQPQKPAVPIRRSVQPDHIVCLEDGKKLKMLKRHLRTTYNMTPDEYRAKWGLPPDYPMVAPNYAAQRSEFAKKIGLGKRARGAGRRRKATAAK